MNSESCIEKRKADHLTLAGSPACQMNSSNGLDTIRFEPVALPELNFAEIDSQVEFLNKPLSFPFLISSMSGGVREADRMNITLAEAAETCQVALGVGSMRIALEQKSAQSSFKLRKFAPSIPILANIGGTQLVQRNGISDALRCIELADADGIYVHLNALQELLQPGGDQDWRGVSAAIKKFVTASPVPVFIKEVGHGISASSAEMLIDLGVSWIDVAGSGGTSWSQIEHIRSGREGVSAFADWGVNTKEAIESIRSKKLSCMLVGSGGLRNGLDVAKVIRIGADMGAAAQPFLEPARLSVNKTMQIIESWEKDFKIAMFSTGSKNLAELKTARLLAGGSHSDTGD